MQRIFLLFVISIVAAGVHAQSNFDFESGLEGWSSGTESREALSVDTLHAYKGRSCIKISGAQTALFQQLPVDPLGIVEMHVFIKSATMKGGAYAFTRFYDSQYRLLMEMKTDPAGDTAYRETGIYTEAPPFTAFARIGVEKDSTAVTAYADQFSIKTNIDAVAKEHQPLYDFREYMLPFWKADTIYNETVLLYAENGGAAKGRLLFHPSRILSVKSFDLRSVYKPGIDYALDGNIITRRPQSAMPFKPDTSFDRIHNLAWYDLQSQWVVVSYTHTEKWKGPVPTYKGASLPETTRKLLSGAPLTVVAYGMSITRGLNVSGYDQVPPYMPSYMELMTEGLRQKYGNDNIRLYNAALPGAAIDWGAKNAEQYINPLKPDLVVIDFGMNDFWRLTPAEFKVYLQAIIGTVRAANPRAEFVLISNMKFDPEYILESDKNKKFYVSNMYGYNTVLQQSEGRGIINFDMTSLSDAIYKRKKARDCISNPLHPNDYLARWYAQGLLALLCR